MDLVLERREQDDTSLFFGDGLAVTTPDINEDYWSYRVRLTETQAVIGFPKIGTIGIGFAVEDDWNRNLPYRTKTAEEIAAWIAPNKGDDSIRDEDVLAAVRLIQQAAREDRGDPDERCPQCGRHAALILVREVHAGKRLYRCPSCGYEEAR